MGLPWRLRRAPSGTTAKAKSSSRLAPYRFATFNLSKVELVANQSFRQHVYRNDTSRPYQRNTRAWPDKIKAKLRILFARRTQFISFTRLQSAELACLALSESSLSPDKLCMLILELFHVLTYERLNPLVEGMNRRRKQVNFELSRYRHEFGRKASEIMAQNWGKTFDKKIPVWTCFFRRCPQKFFRSRASFAISVFTFIFSANVPIEDTVKAVWRFKKQLEIPCRENFCKNRNSRSGFRPVGAKLLLRLLEGTGLSGGEKLRQLFLWPIVAIFQAILREVEDDLSALGVGTVAKRIFLEINGFISAGHAWNPSGLGISVSDGFDHAADGWHRYLNVSKRWELTQRF